MAIAIDFETKLISEQEPWPFPVCLSYADDNTKGIIIGKDEIGVYLKNLFATQDLIIAHNAAFELNVIFTWFPELRQEALKAVLDKRVVCTQVVEQIIDLQRPKQQHKKSLAACALRYFDIDISEDKTEDSWRYRYEELIGVSEKQWPKKAIDYAIQDSVLTYRLWNKQKFIKIDWTLSVQSEILLNYIGTKGFEVNTKRVDELEEEIYATLKPDYEYLESLGLLTFKEGSRRPKKNTKIFQQWVAENIKEPLKTKKGNIAVDKESLVKYNMTNQHPVFDSFVKIAMYDKILTSYISNLKGNTLIRAQYNSVKSTGRTSSFGSSLYPSVNIQQMPREVPGLKWDVRNCLVPRKGYKIFSIDYSGLELASVGNQLKKVLHWSKLAEALNEGNSPADLHSKFAARLMSLKTKQNVTYEEFKKRKKEKEFAKYRQLAKPLNLGFPGGIGYDTMRKLLAKDGIYPKWAVLQKSNYEEFLWPLYYSLRRDREGLRIARINYDEWALVYDELVELKNAMFDLYPDLREFLKDTHKKFLNGNSGWKKNDWGDWEEDQLYDYTVRTPVGEFTRKNCTYTALCNGYLMQTASAIGGKYMMIKEISKYFDSKICIPLAFIHDEIVGEVVDSSENCAIIKDVATIMLNSMSEALPNVRIAVEAEVMPYWKKAGGEWSAEYWKNSGDKTIYEGK